VCVAASAALALGLRAEHWYWLPVTAAFLVKPDLGPLFSRVVNRFAGTVAGVLLAAALGLVADVCRLKTRFLAVGTAVAAAFVVPYGEMYGDAGTVAGVLLVAGLGPVLSGPWWPVVAVAVTGALVPVAQRHFAAQTAVITVTVLAFVTTGGDRAAAPARLLDTTLACALVLLVGHLPGLADTRARVGQRAAHALRHTQRYLDHVLLTGPGPYYAPLAEFEFDKARRDLDAHILLPIAVAQHAAGKVRPGGTLLFMGGTGGRRTAPGFSLISALTAAGPAKVRNLALELAPIRVNLIAAGFVDTPLSASLLGDQLDARRAELRDSLPIRRVVGPSDIAALAVHLMVNTALTGATYDIDGGQQLV